MKNTFLYVPGNILAFSLVLLLLPARLFSQTASDSLYLPPIKITSLNGYGPFVLGSERSNLFILYQLPQNTSKVIMKMIDSKGVQVNSAHTLSGSNLQTAEWSFESDTMGFPLSPQLSIEVYYKNDSIAIYNIPYTVYPDTVSITASAGFGPFTTNNYPYADTSWHPVPQKFNTFTVKHLPPRTDTIVFQIMTIDSVIVLSSKVTAPAGTYLDSAEYKNVRMDQLPLDTKYLRTLIWCQGGPDGGLEYHKELAALPQKPRLICTSDSLVLTDSIGVFVQNQISGQALAVDSVKNALIQNGPGSWDLDNHLQTIYPGPYSIDYMQSSFSIEAWVNLNLTGLTEDVQSMDLMAVDSVWQLYAEASIYGMAIFFSTSAGLNSQDLWSVSLDMSQTPGNGWHHIAFTCYYNNTGSYPSGKFYLDGLPLPGVHFNHANYNYIYSYIDWRRMAGTQPLRLGSNYNASNSLVTAMDEVRIWARTLSDADIWYNYMKSPLQEDALLGYWNFDDLRNRLNYISDRSYKNNFGYLKNKAYFIPQFPGIQRTIDTLKIFSSNIHTDSVKYVFVDRNNVNIDSCTMIPSGGKVTLGYDVASLPFNISKLKVLEYFHPSTGIPVETDFNLCSLAPEPIATPQYNWNTYYTTPTSMGMTYAPVTVSGLPSNTSKIMLGLMNGNEVYDTVTYTASSIPYHHFLTLDGSDNYIQTSQNISSPQSFSIMFWVRTSTGSGGKIIGFSDSQNGTSTAYHDREIILGTDGSLKFNMLDGGTTKTLYALNINNDGTWHHVAATLDNNQNASIYVDGSLSQSMSLTNPSSYQGWWVIGRNAGVDDPGNSTVAEYFSGSLSEVSIWNSALSYTEINALRYQSSGNPGQVLYYKFNEGSGTTVTDHAGSNNGTINGTAPVWFVSNALSDVVWNNNITALQPGTYTFFANVSYPFGPSGGASYQLGNFMVTDAFPDYTFNFMLSEGQGYFSQGISLINTLSVESDYTGSNNPGWSKNYVKVNFLTIDHELIYSDSATYTGSSYSGQFDIYMGDAPPGSYISLETGYYTTSPLEIFQNSVSIPIYIHPMIPPTVNGNFGPFDQAVAPGTMQHPNTFTLSMEPLTDIDSIVAVFYDNTNLQIGRCDAVKVSDTLWTVTYDMSLLSPPVTNMNLEYYMGQDTHPAAIEGPYPISITKTRPAWIDFLPASNFSNIQQSGNLVNFTVNTPFEKIWRMNPVLNLTIPSWVPLIGGTSTSMNSPTANAYLQYNISGHSFSFTQPPDFFQEVTKLGVTVPTLLKITFTSSQNNSYSLDSNNNLIATQNYSRELTSSADIMAILELAKTISSLVSMSGSVDPASIIVQASFKLSVSSDYEYASRLHMMTDTATGNWGSFGNLDIDADSSHGEAYKNSASYHFFAGTIGVEFSVGAKILEGMASGYFGLDGRIEAGYGHSYITIPSSLSKQLNAVTLQVYGRFYVELLWGWYEKNLWGPRMFYSTNLWGDDMKNCFPPPGKNSREDENILANSTWPELSDEIIPVSDFTKMAPPTPHQSVGSSDENNVFSWVENGRKYGERVLKIAYLPVETQKFSDKIKIELNSYALNSPATDAVANNQVLLCWAQTRYDNKSILGVKPDNILSNFLKAQDIWYAVYDIPSQKVMQTNMISDDTTTVTSGRTEANPSIVTLSDTKALIVWQVADLDNHVSEIWYVSLENQSGHWITSEPGVVSGMAGVKTELTVGVPEPGKAVLTWINTTGDLFTDKKLMTSEFDGSSWASPSELISFGENQTCNYYDMKFKDGKGVVAIASFIKDSTVNNYEKLILLPWDKQSKKWNREKSTDILTEPVGHLQLPRIAIQQDGQTSIAVKIEKIGKKPAEEKISQVDLLTGNLNNLSAGWKRVRANEYVCDTTKQVAEIALTYVGTDTLMILTNEYPMLATNALFTPLNGIMFGDPAMNLVLRCFSIENDSIIKDVPENRYFTGVQEPEIPPASTGLIRIYPNPCSDYAVATFDIPEKAHTKLDLFDMKGSFIATLIDQELPRGSYEMKLNTSFLKPGMYTFRMMIGQRVDAIKISVIQ